MIKWSLNRQIRHLEKGKSQKESHNLKPISKNLILLRLQAQSLQILPLKKKKPSRRNYSSQELESLEELSLEELLRSVQTLEESLQDLPSIEDTIAEVERLTEQMEKELEEYLNEP